MTKLSHVFLCLAALCSVTVRAAEAEVESGLVANYSDGKHRIVTVAATPNFVLKEAESIHPQLQSTFTAEWNGLLKIIKQAPYSFSFDGAARSKILIDGKEIQGKPIDLDLGDHAIQIIYARKPGAVRGQLVWSSDYFVTESVPPAVLSHRDAPAELSLTARIDAGQFLVEQLNCTACHASSSTSLTARLGPDLSIVGTRLHTAWVARWIEKPHAFRADTAMPHASLNSEECRDVAAYLATLKNANNKVKEPQPSVSHVETGRHLVETVGCTACHGGAKGNSLEGLGSKWLPGQLAEFLLNPKSVDHSGRMPSMLLAKGEAQAIAEFERKLAGGDVKRGAQLLQDRGCVNCHTTGGTSAKPPAAATLSTSLEHLTGVDKGCLSEHPGGRAMDYRLNVTQRESIAAFIDSIRAHPMVSVAPAFEFEHRAKLFGCINCHELNASIPPDTTERIPQLTNVGGRLQKEWIGEVLTQKRRVRPWLRRRMPEFDAEAIGDVPAFAVAASGAGDAGAWPSPTRGEIAAGQKLLGNGAGGFGCITCHGFGGATPNVIDDTRGPDITTVATRLRPDHFHRWVLDPKRVSPSTPMPSFFDGMPVAEAHAKVETMYRYVAMGENMPPPVGWVDKNNYQLAVHEVPVVMRAFMPDDHGKNLPRAIAVGLPGLVNYCFDGDSCMLRYAWTGGFVDMQPSWSGRGGNVVKVLGKRFFDNPTFVFKMGEDKHTPERRFEGYEMVNQIPVFTYTIDGVRVRETIAFSVGTSAANGEAANKSLTPPELLDTVEIDESTLPLFLVAPADRDLVYGRVSKEGAPVGETLPRGQSVKLDSKPVKIVFMIPLKESK